MRSKEVDLAIDITKQLQQFIKKGGRKLTFYDNENCVIAYENLGILLSYIEELEEKCKKCEYYEEVADELYKNSINKDKIRDKIKEVCNNHDYVDNDFIYDLKKGLLGE